MYCENKRVGKVCKREEWQVHLKPSVIALAQHMAQAPVCCLQAQLMGTNVPVIAMAHIFFNQMISEVKYITEIH